VALDHVGWRVLDAKRVAVGMKPIAQNEPDKYNSRRVRQPEHIEIAGAMGLGVWDWDKIDLRKKSLA
jgi:hypothetical protein